MSISLSLTDAQRQMIEDIKRETTSRVEARRCRIILLLDKKLSVGQIASMVDCVRSTVYTTLYRFEDEGLHAFADKRLCPEPRKATAQVRAKLLSYLDKVPKDFGWRRSTWTLELLARQLEEDTSVRLSPSHLRKVLAQEKCRRGRPRPALRIPVKGRRNILENIAHLEQAATQDEEFVYLDEADVDLNPRIGLTYMKKGQQTLVLTPGQNVKYYLAGALNPRTGTVLYSHGPRKDSQLFIDLLHVLARSYRRARVINVVLDNYIIHKSQKTHKALDGFGGRIRLHFLPPYSPEHNPIERLWKQLHDNVTRNHRHPNMPSLWKDITTFMATIQPFPGTKFSTLKEIA